MNAHVDLMALRRAADDLDTICGGDDRLFADMMEGETDIDRIALRIYEQVARDEETLAGIVERQRALAERKKRIEARRDSGKAFIGKALRIARMTKLELPEVTLSVRDGKAKLKVVDPAAVPDDYVTFKPTPSMTKINEDFAPDSDLPNWLVVEPATDVVTARTR